MRFHAFIQGTQRVQAIRLLIACVLGWLFPAQLQAGVLPPQSSLFGKSMADYSVDWYLYNFTLSTNQDPVHLPAGSLGGPVYFLASSAFAAPSAEPVFTLPENAYVFFPIMTVEADNIDTDPLYTVEELRDLAAAIIDLITNVHASIDGIPLADLLAYREMSPVFAGFFPTEDNSYTKTYEHPIVGLVEPMVADGYYVMLEPLTVGTHDLIVGAEFAPPLDGASYSTTFHFQVEPVLLERWIDEFLPVVTEVELDERRKRQLLWSLNAARKAFASGHGDAGLAHLRGFQRQVSRWLASSDPVLSDDLIGYVQRLLDRAEQLIE